MLHAVPDDAWDARMRSGAEDGRLDRVLREVDAEIEADRVRELP